MFNGTIFYFMISLKEDKELHTGSFSCTNDICINWDDSTLTLGKKCQSNRRKGDFI